MTESPLRIWKFIVAKETTLPGTSRTYEYCLAVAIATSEAEARAIIVADGLADGYDTSWLVIARVAERTLTPGVVAVSF